MNYEEEWEEEEEEGEDIGGIWHVVRGGRLPRNRKRQDTTGSTPRRRYKCRWDALEEEEEEDAGDVMQLGSDQLDWEEVKITIDSGAVGTVGPKEVGKVFPVLPTEASKKGMFYRAANNTKIAIHGKKALRGYTREGSDIGIDLQVADVKKALGSVRRMCEAGNNVVFDDAGSYIENKRTGERATLIKERGSYILSLWVPKKPQEQPFARQGGKAWGA